jgi:hypothetical protein
LWWISCQNLNFNYLIIWDTSKEQKNNRGVDWVSWVWIKLSQHTLNNNNGLELSNAFDCVSQKENILLNTENKRMIGVLTSALTGFGLNIYAITRAWIQLQLGSVVQRQSSTISHHPPQQLSFCDYSQNGRIIQSTSR